VLNLIERFDLLVPEPLPSPIEQLKLQGRQRRRASSARVQDPTPQKWQWGDDQ
jgi:hypothetical protein